MLLKSGSTVTDTAFQRPGPEDKAWIDLDPQQALSLRDVLASLGWSSDVARLVDDTPDRAQLVYVDSLLVLSLFVPEGDQLKGFQIIQGPGVLITIHAEPLKLLTELQHDVPPKPDLLESAHYLLYELLARTADAYLERMDIYEETFDRLEEAILDGHDRARDVFALRRTLHHMRSALADLRRIAARLSRRQFGPSANDASIFVDVYDGFYHVMDNIDSLRDNLTGLVDLQLNQRSTRMNEIMKFLTIFSTIFLPLSFITGFLGMNLKSMPELGIPYGQEFTMILMLAIAAGMLTIFKRRGWF